MARNLTGCPTLLTTAAALVVTKPDRKLQVILLTKYTPSFKSLANFNFYVTNIKAVKFLTKL